MNPARLLVLLVLILLPLGVVDCEEEEKLVEIETDKQRVINNKFKIMSESKKLFRIFNQFNTNEYIKSGSTLVGTEAILTGILNDKLRWTKKHGDIISIREKDSNQSIPVLVPPFLKDLNICIGDQVTLKIKIRNDTMLIAKEISKHEREAQK